MKQTGCILHDFAPRYPREDSLHQMEKERGEAVVNRGSQPIPQLRLWLGPGN
jgi:hypothetical protein